MLASKLMQSVISAKTYLLNANANDINLAVIAGNPTKKGKWRFIVSPGVIIGNVSASAAMTVGQFPADSQIDIYINGSVQGRGGVGGTYSSSTGPVAGTNGGNCIKADYLNQIVRIFNTGDIRAGGGGAGSGGQGGNGGNGGRGNIISTTAYEQPRSDVEWYIFDASPNDNHVSWFGSGGNDSNGPGETLMIAPLGLFEKGDYWGHTQDANPHNSWWVRLHTLAPAGIGGPLRAGGTGGNGAGFNQARNFGQIGEQSVAGSDPGNGAGKGGASGNAGKGGDGGDWGANATVGNAGNTGLAGNTGVYEGGFAGAGGGLPASSGLGGSYLVKGTANVTFSSTGTVIGKLS